jgi:hypothetical protein
VGSLDEHLEPVAPTTMRATRNARLRWFQSRQTRSSLVTKASCGVTQGRKYSLKQTEEASLVQQLPTPMPSIPGPRAVNESASSMKCAIWLASAGSPPGKEAISAPHSSPTGHALCSTGIRSRASCSHARGSHRSRTGAAETQAGVAVCALHGGESPTSLVQHAKRNARTYGLPRDFGRRRQCIQEVCPQPPFPAPSLSQPLLRNPHDTCAEAVTPMLHGTLPRRRACQRIVLERVEDDGCAWSHLAG